MASGVFATSISKGWRLIAVMAVISAAAVSCGRAKPSHDRPTASGPSQVGTSASESSQTGTEAWESSAGLPLPDIPVTITDHEERADYLAFHFWDAMDFTDSDLLNDTVFIEQTFANYASVLPFASENGREASVGKLLDRARETSPEAYDRLNDIALHYLYDPESPVYSEDCYLPFADYLIAASAGTDQAAIARRDEIMMNRPGSKAPDFSFETPSTAKRRLIQPADEAGTLLMFYDPDCDRCHDIIDLLSGDPVLERAIADGALRVVAIYSGSDYDAWLRHASSLPRAWETGIQRSGAADSLYSVRATPSFYLIAPDGIIVLKDAPIQSAAQTLGLAL